MSTVLSPRKSSSDNPCFWCGFKGKEDDLHGCSQEMRNWNKGLLYLLRGRSRKIFTTNILAWRTGFLAALSGEQFNEQGHRHYICGYRRGMLMKADPLYSQLWETIAMEVTNGSV